MGSKLTEVIRACLTTMGGTTAGFPQVSDHLSFDDLYQGNLQFPVLLSDKVRRLAGTQVAMTGYLASLDPAAPTTFVLTRTPMRAALVRGGDGWATDIVLVQMQSPAPRVPRIFPVDVYGRLEAGLAQDPDFGWASHLRLVDAGVAQLL